MISQRVCALAVVFAFGGASRFSLGYKFGRKFSVTSYNAAMEDQVSSQDIALIEARIEELAEAIERCRKFSLAGKVALVAGAVWIALTLLTLVPYVPFMVIGALAFVIGGIVLVGSNTTTWAQTEASLRASEAMRAEMISRVEMRVVNASVRRLH